jgi:hypothetical protein
MQVTRTTPATQDFARNTLVARAIRDDVSVEVTRLYRGADIGHGAAWTTSASAVEGAQLLSQGDVQGAVGVFRDGDHFVASDLLAAGTWEKAPHGFELYSSDDISTAARTLGGRSLVAIVDGDVVVAPGSYRSFEHVLDSYGIPADERG